MSKASKIVDVATLASYTMAQRVEFYNANCAAIDAKPVKKFADRKAAERRCALVAEALAAAAKPAKGKKVATDSAEPADRSAAVAATWTDAEVRAARSARHQVKVGKEVYGSFMKACLALNVDLASHITARGTMVREGSVEFRGHKFTLVAAK